MSINFHNDWITPADFGACVNQGHEIVGSDSKVESDQQNRGFRWPNAGSGSARLTITSPVKPRVLMAPRATSAMVIYPTAEDSRITCAIVDAAARVRDLNFKYINEGKGATVTSRFGEDGITIVDPNRAMKGVEAVFEKIYTKPI